MRAFSLLQVKAVDDEKRIITGMATTPTADRVGDVVEPNGVIYRSAINLHLYHDHDKPVGNVVFGKATDKGIPFTATLPEVVEDGAVKDRVDEAWHSVKYKLLGAVSIGFRAMEDGIEYIKGGGLRFTKWEMLELSLVSVPANPDAVIQSFKSHDSAGISRELGIKLTDSDEREKIIKKITKGAVALTQPSRSDLNKGAVFLSRS